MLIHEGVLIPIGMLDGILLFFRWSHLCSPNFHFPTFGVASVRAHIQTLVSLEYRWVRARQRHLTNTTRRLIVILGNADGIDGASTHQNKDPKAAVALPFDDIVSTNQRKR